MDKLVSVKSSPTALSANSIETLVFASPVKEECFSSELIYLTRRRLKQNFWPGRRLPVPYKVHGTKRKEDKKRLEVGSWEGNVCTDLTPNHDGREAVYDRPSVQVEMKKKQ